MKENEQKPKSAVSNTLLSQTSADSETAGGNAGKSLFQRWFPGWSGWYCRESGPATNVGGATSNPEASPVSRIGHLELNTSPDDAAIGDGCTQCFVNCCTAYNILFSMTVSLTLYINPSSNLHRIRLIDVQGSDNAS